jgi:hypothetical protein
MQDMQGSRGPNGIRDETFDLAPAQVKMSNFLFISQIRQLFSSQAPPGYPPARRRRGDCQPGGFVLKASQHRKIIKQPAASSASAS